MGDFIVAVNLNSGVAFGGHFFLQLSRDFKCKLSLVNLHNSWLFLSMFWVCSDILVSKFNTLVSISCLKALNWSCKVSKLQSGRNFKGVELSVAWVKDISCNRDFWYDASINSCSCSMVEQCYYVRYYHCQHSFGLLPT